MADICGGGVGFTTGSGCFEGNIRGFSVSDDAITKTNEEIANKVIWDSMALDPSNRLFSILNAPTNEIIDTEPINVSWDFEGDEQVGKKLGGLTLHFKDNCYNMSLLKMTGKIGYVFLHTDKDGVLGIGKDLNRSLRSVKVYFSVVKSVNDKVPIIKVTMTFKEDFDDNKSGAMLDFDNSEIATADKVYLEESSAVTATTIAVSAWDKCSRSHDLNMETTGFTYTDASGAVLTPSGVVLTGNEYVATFASLPTAGTNVTASYVSATIADLYDVKNAIIVTV